MQTSPAGRAAIISYEGLRVEAYQDSAGFWTIGVGHVPATMGQRITLDEAQALLAVDLKRAEDCVTTAVKVSLSQWQFDALVSFVFNLGCGAFRGSTLLKLLNAGNFKGAADQFTNWVYAGGKQIPGILARREAEKRMFLRTDGIKSPQV